jgi:RNA polymerase sigma-70 factor (ECF subfamily)
MSASISHARLVVDEVAKNDNDVGTTVDPMSTLVEGLRARRRAAERRLVVQFGPVVEGTLVRVLGTHREIADLTQEVFLRTIERVGELREADAFPGFIRSIAIFVAREAIRRQRRKRWLSFFAPAEVPERHASTVDPEARAAVRAFYEIVERMSADEQIVFTLRFVEGLELLEIVEQCGLSLSTVKRRLRDAEAVFLPAAKRSEELSSWLAEGSRWS